MDVKNQFKRVKENWLIVVGLIVIILILNNFNVSNISNPYTNSFEKGEFQIGYGEEVASYRAPDMDFAPDVEERIVTKTVSASLEIERGDFDMISSSLKNHISKAEGIIINENINSYGEGITKRKIGYYSIRVPENKYDSFILKAKSLGEIESFNENSEDITGDYIKLEDRIKLEKQRLERYEGLFESAKTTEEKISLTDRIFNQERTIKYLEDSLKNQNLRIEYINVYLTLNEEESKFVNISIAGLGEIIRSFVNSLNKLIILIVWVIPWIIIFFIGKYLFKVIKKK